MENEEVSCLGSLKHDIFRTVLGRYNFQDPVEVASFADIPSGTGLGSSGSFTVALCAALKSYFDIPLDKHVIASEATQIEMNELGRPVGLQDQYAASFGDFHEYRVSSSGKVKESRIVLDDRAQSFVENNLLLFFTNGLREFKQNTF